MISWSLRLAWVVSFAVSTLAGAEKGSFPLEPEQWPALLRITRQVPGFAGLTSNSTGQIFLSLTNVSQARQVLPLLRKDPYWKTYSLRSTRAIKAQFSGPQLVTAARALLNLRPDLRVSIDSSLNRVVLDLPIADTVALARQAGVSGMVVSGRQRANLHATMLPLKLSLNTLSSTPHGEWNVPLRLTNVMKRPTVFEYGCSGRVEIEILSWDGEKVQSQAFGCTLAAQMVILQPGESVQLRSVLESDLRALSVGRYFWHILDTDERISFSILP